AGTDPAEGSALARALLEELHEAGCRTIATTHYNELKTFAYQRKGMENASVEFDEKTLKPTYRLLIGHAGASNALAVAQRLGLPRRIVASARRLLGRRGREVDEALRAIERSRRSLEDRRREAEDLSAQLERLRAQHERELARLEEERKRLAQRGYERARKIVAAAEEEARRIIAELQRQPRQSKVTQRLREELTSLAAHVEAQGRELLGVEAGTGQPRLLLRAGDWVRIKSSGNEGEIEQVEADRAVVRVGKLAVEAPLSDLELADEPGVSPEASALAQRMRSKKALSVPTEIHLLGMRADEAIHVLEKFLDDAFLAGHPRLRIVHGKGTGALRQAIHAWLREQPMVRGFALASPSEGGSGVTIVEL
ncbi:MAG: Smr/MutS family protein, partial [Armatimonadetes bacterium]|nr:Smr/MutS family protein [Armatimonadota bacterium]